MEKQKAENQYHNWLYFLNRQMTNQYIITEKKFLLIYVFYKIAKWPNISWSSR